jgi:hypothetical protein
MSLPAYVLKGVKRAAIFMAASFVSSGINTRSVTAGIVASTTHTIAGGTPLTTEINVIGTCANAGDAVTLPVLTPGQSCEVYNAGAAAAGVYPAASGVAIDGGSAGAAVTLTNGKRARFTCTAANTIVSAQFGVASA